MTFFSNLTDEWLIDSHSGLLVTAQDKVTSWWSFNDPSGYLVNS